MMKTLPASLRVLGAIAALVVAVLGGLRTFDLLPAGLARELSVEAVVVIGLFAAAALVVSFLVPGADSK